MLHDELIKAGIKHLIETLKKCYEDNIDEAEEVGVFFDELPLFASEQETGITENSYQKLAGDLLSLLSLKAAGGQESMQLETQETAMYDLAHLMESANLSSHPVPLNVVWLFNFEKRTVHYNEELVYQGH